MNYYAALSSHDFIIINFTKKKLNWTQPLKRDLATLGNFTSPSLAPFSQLTEALIPWRSWPIQGNEERERRTRDQVKSWGVCVCMNVSDATSLSWASLSPFLPACLTAFTIHPSLPFFPFMVSEHMRYLIPVSGLHMRHYVKDLCHTTSHYALPSPPPPPHSSSQPGDTEDAEA